MPGFGAVPDPRHLLDRIKKLETNALARGDLAGVVTSVQKGQVSGFGNPQNDTYTPFDNVDASHPLNVRYVIPGNMQRLVAARLSFHLAPYRTYDVTAAAGLHVHYWSGSGTTATVAANGVYVDALGALHTGPGPGAGVPSVPVGKQTSTEHVGVAAGGSVDTAIEGWDATGHTHAQVLGVVEGTTATSISIGFDGVDRTAVLGGPWTADVLELDVLTYVNTAKGAYRVVTLTPNQNGRLEAHLRLTYFADGSIR